MGDLLGVGGIVVIEVVLYLGLRWVQRRRGS